MALAFGLCALFIVVGTSGCATFRAIPGTKIPDTPINRTIVERVEEYRVAMEKREPAHLLAMASPNYYEDSGTTSGSDDYGYPGLKRVLESRLSAVRWMRFLIRYRDVRIEGDRATVDLRYDLSYQILTDIGEKWERKQNDKRLELVMDKNSNHWLFISGY